MSDYLRVVSFSCQVIVHSIYIVYMLSVHFTAVHCTADILEALDLLTANGKKKATRGRNASREEPPWDWGHWVGPLAFLCTNTICLSNLSKVFSQKSRSMGWKDLCDSDVTCSQFDTFKNYPSM